MKEGKELLYLVIESFTYDRELTCSPGDILSEMHKLCLPVQQSSHMC